MCGPQKTNSTENQKLISRKLKTTHHGLSKRKMSNATDDSKNSRNGNNIGNIKWSDNPDSDDDSDIMSSLPHSQTSNYQFKRRNSEYQNIINDESSHEENQIKSHMSEKDESSKYESHDIYIIKEPHVEYKEEVPVYNFDTARSPEKRLK